MDLKDIYVCNDTNFLYIMVTTWDPTVLVSSINNFYFDTDNNPGTGYANRNGSELLVQNGAGYQEKAGIFNAGTVSGLQFLCAPAGTNSQFEFRISLAALNTSDGSPVFKTNVINFSFDAQNSGFQTINRVPTSGGTLQYTILSPSISLPGPLAISFSGGQVAISWPGSGTLQASSTPISGFWTNVQAATNPFMILPTAMQQYFRLLR